MLTEKVRIQSSDSRVDAVLAENESGATTPVGMAVYIVKHGKKISSEDAGFKCDHYSQIQISWSANKQLLISYNRARIFGFTNFWEDNEVDKFKYVVEVSLNCISADHHQLEEQERNP